MLPTPKTTFLRDDARCGHFTQANARCRNAAKAAAFSTGDCGWAIADGVSPGNASESSAGLDDGTGAEIAG